MRRLLAWLEQSWFPAALVALVSLALPGLVFVLLALFGADVAVRDWLQQNLQIGYQLALAPIWVLVLLLLPLVVVLLYFLKLKRKPLQVPSTYLWRKSIEDLHVNALLQWLRKNVLLVLQILAILFLTYTVLGPRYHGGKNRSRHYILLIDNSASMSATDVAPTRLDWAKQEALKEIDAAGDDDFGMVIVFNSKAATLQTYTNNRGRLREVVRDIPPTARTTRMEEAVALAESLANPIRSTEDASVQPDNVAPQQERTMVEAKGVSATVHLFSDGRFPRLSETALAALGSRQAGNFSDLGNLDVRYHCAGRVDAGHADNVGIVALSAARLNPPSARSAGDEVQKLQALVRVLNYRRAPSSVKLRLDVFAGGELKQPEQRTLELPARTVAEGEAGGDEKDEPGSAVVAVDLPALDTRKPLLLHAYLDSARDAFALDDHAWLALSTARKARVLIVGPPNRILDAAFDQEAARRRAETERLSVAALATDDYRKRARSGEIDLVIFDRCTPATEADLPLANTLFIDQVPRPWERGKRVMQNPLPVPSRQAHPLLRHITTLWDVRVAEAFAFDLVDNLEPKAREQARQPDGDPSQRVLPALTRIVETSSRSGAKGQPPLIFALARGPYTDLVLTFALLGEQGELATDWPLLPSFPLFIRNVLQTLGHADETLRPAGTQAGEPMVLRPEASVERVVVTSPAGTEAALERVQGRPEFVYGATDNLGVYRYRPQPGDDLQRAFAVNLLDPGESNIEPRPKVSLGNQEVVAGQDRSQPLELWKWVLVLALLVLVAEWAVYHRRIAV